MNRIAKNWDWNQYDLLKVTYHIGDDFVSVQDGWHRVNAAKLSNEEYNKNIIYLPCRVFINLNHEEELNLFLNQQENVTRLRIVDKFPSLIEKGDKTTIEFINICKKREIIISGFNENEIKTHRKIGSIKTSLNIINKFGIEAFDFCLETIFKAKWENRQGSFSGALLKSLVDFYNNPCKILIQEKIVEILKELKTIQSLNIASGTTNRGNESCYTDYFLKRINDNNTFIK